MKIKNLLFTLALCVALLVGAMFPLRATSAQFIDRITRPCAAGATPRALVITNPNSNNNVEITTCTGGSLLLNGVAIVGGATINPTNGVIPYRSNATTFSDSPLTRTSASLVTSTAGLVFSVDNTLDIGASGATRPRTGFFGTSLISPLFNGLVITNNGTNTLNIAAGKTFTLSNTLTFTGTDASSVAFGAGGTVVYTGLITGSGLTQNTARLLGRSTAATGAIEEIILGTNLSFTGTTLNATGGATINASDTFIPYRSNATTFADSPLSRTSSTNVALAGQLTVTQGTLTASTPFINHTATWNNAGVTFENIVTNITNTTSGGSSTLIDLKVAGVSQFNVTRGGTVNGGAFNGNSFVVSAAQFFAWIGRSIMYSPANGAWTLSNAAETSGIRLQVGAPSIASGFGTSPALVAGSTDSAGSIDVGTGGIATSGVINFQQAWTSAPFCVVQDSTTGILQRASATTAALTITSGSVWIANDKINWQCIGSR